VPSDYMYPAGSMCHIELRIQTQEASDISASDVKTQLIAFLAYLPSLPKPQEVSTNKGYFRLLLWAGFILFYLRGSLTFAPASNSMWRWTLCRATRSPTFSPETTHRQPTCSFPSRPFLTVFCPPSSSLGIHSPIMSSTRFPPIPPSQLTPSQQPHQETCVRFGSNMGPFTYQNPEGALLGPFALLLFVLSWS
jgi:hypothetical protein